MNTAFAFCGPIGSGKSSVSKAFAARIGAGWNSFGNTVKQIVDEAGLPLTRETLQRVGEELVQKNPTEFCNRVISGAQLGSATPVVIDGIRHISILELLRSLIFPRSFACIYVESPLQLRLQRVKQRDGVSVERLAVLEKHSTEVEVQKQLRDRADLIIQNSDSLEQCVNEIRDWAAEKKLLPS
jgi:dephospho-CoA kinase